MVGDLYWRSPQDRKNIHSLTYYILQLKILHNMVDIPLMESINAYKHDFFPAPMNLWNELPSHIAYAPRNAPTINNFCNLLYS